MQPFPDLILHRIIDFALKSPEEGFALLDVSRRWREIVIPKLLEHMGISNFKLGNLAWVCEGMEKDEYLAEKRYRLHFLLSYMKADPNLQGTKGYKSTPLMTLVRISPKSLEHRQYIFDTMQFLVNRGANPDEKPTKDLLGYKMTPREYAEKNYELALPFLNKGLKN